MMLDAAGQQLQEVIVNAQRQTRGNLKYLIVIEGMASNDGYRLNWELSYNRARAVYEFWKSKRIGFDPAICEVIVSGSGIEGVGRDTIEQVNNQRILVQILPKHRQRVDQPTPAQSIKPSKASMK